MKEDWRVWNNDKVYGDLFYKRATGELPEMESSKALAKIVVELIRENDKILDVGCGGGHYLRSLDNALNVKFLYEGIDATEYYIKRANDSFPNSLKSKTYCTSAKFMVGDIFNLPIKNIDSEIVICNNVFLHLPSIEKPLTELIRVSKKFIIIRTLVGSNSFRIKQIEKPENYYENGEPINYHYYNIYSESYIIKLLEKLNITSYTFHDDTDYDPSAFGDSTNYIGERPDDLTTTINGIQLNNYILQPWKFIVMEK